MFECQAATCLYDGPWVAERWAQYGEFIASHPGSALAVTEQVLRSGAKPDYDAAALFRTMHNLQALKMRVKQLLRDAVLLLPTCGGTWRREQVRREPIGTNAQLGLYTNHCNLLDLCAVALPNGEAEPGVPFGVTAFALSGREELLEGAATCLSDLSETTFVAVCGLHMRGFPLERQMRMCGARFVREAATAAAYRMVKLPTSPAKPGLVRRQEGGVSVQVEIWEMPVNAFGRFVASVPPPLAIGKVELFEGSSVPGFICEQYAAVQAEDISSFGGWRSYDLSARV